MLKYLIVLLLFCTNLAIAQVDPTVSTTDNLATSNQNGSTTTTPWQNVGQWGGSLTCWGPGGPGYCGPNPYVNANGQGVINFSYGYTDLHQIVTIANALPNTGTGLRVNGFNFGFMAKNGNGWDNGQQDYLAAYVQFYDNTGKVVESFDYSASTNRVYNWTQFNFSENFSNPYASSSLGTARYGFVGYDTNFWAGPYGPEIYNVNFSLKYSVDPCANNPLSNPTCPGFNDALEKLTPTTTTQIAQVEQISTQIESTPLIANIPATSNSTNNILSNPTVVVMESQAVQKNEKSIVSAPSLTSILQNIRNNEQKQQSIAMAAVSAANQIATNTVEQADKIALAVNASTNSNTVSGFNTSTNVVNKSNNILSMQNELKLNNIVSINELSFNQEIKVPILKSPVTEIITNSIVSENISNTNIAFGKKGDPLQDYIETNNQFFADNNTEIKQTTVKQNVQDSELAGASRIEQIAVVPNGFSLYSQFILTNIAFYEPKEIYKNVVIKDNVRSMYFIEKANTDTYNKMIDSQYK